MAPNNTDNYDHRNKKCITEDDKEKKSQNDLSCSNSCKNQVEATESNNPEKRNTISKYLGLQTDLIWFNLTYMIALHTLAFYSLFTFPYLTHFRSTLFIILMAIVGLFGNTGGCHRHWSHRSYKAKLPLRIILLLSHCSSGLYSVLNWVKDHRVHHRYTDTNADPHNSDRGFFFSHSGWIVMKTHPECEKRLKEVDLRDILADPVVVFGEKYFQLLRLLCCFILPPLVPVYIWNESWYYAVVSQILIRHPLVLHGICSINSVAHYWGSKPYDKNIRPTQSLFVGIFAAGEGWHNYHHCFPWDYKAAEFGNYSVNITTFLIDVFAKIGWAYDLKQVSPNVIKNAIVHRGDGSHILSDECAVPEIK